MIRRSRVFLFASAILCGLALPALALPKTVIILRHGEKENDFALCRIGVDRSLALAAQYLGQGAKQVAVRVRAKSPRRSSPSPCIRSNLRRPPPQPGKCRW